MSVETDTSSPRPETRRIDSRPKVSLWAAACGVGGLLSASALLHPALLIVPGATLLLAAFAVGVDRRSMRSAWGIGLVAAGLFLSVGFSGLAMRSAIRADPLSETHARQFVEFWMSRLQATDLHTAFLLKAEPSRRPPAGTDIAAYLADDPALTRGLNRFYEDPLVRLLRLGIDSQYEHEKTVRFSKRAGEATFWYQIEYSDFELKRRRARAEIVLRYEFGGPGRPSGWWVQGATLPLGYELVDPPD